MRDSSVQWQQRVDELTSLLRASELEVSKALRYKEDWMLEVKKRVVLEERGQSDNVALRAELERSVAKVGLCPCFSFLVLQCLSVLASPYSLLNASLCIAILFQVLSLLPCGCLPVVVRVLCSFLCIMCQTNNRWPRLSKS